MRLHDHNGMLLIMQLLVQTHQYLSKRFFILRGLVHLHKPSTAHLASLIHIASDMILFDTCFILGGRIIITLPTIFQGSRCFINRLVIFTFLICLNYSNFQNLESFSQKHEILSIVCGALVVKYQDMSFECIFECVFFTRFGVPALVNI